MTAGAMTEDKVKAKQAGMNDHVSKPIEIRKLFEALVPDQTRNSASHQFANSIS